MTRHPRPAPRSLTALAALAAAALGSPLAAQASLAVEPEYRTFVPQENPNEDGIDYSIWTEAMKNLVVSMGPSLRQGAGRPDPSFGSRRQYGHVSRYRLEGNRLMFSFLDDAVIDSFTEYRRDLEATADKIDIQKLSRNEQLAYWINLHNVAVVEQIARSWPVRQPREIKVDGVPLDEAGFITVEGVALSPRDIREKIVYPNWRDPKVIYGFWRGEIGGPSIQREAFNAENVARLLEKGASEFVNSLRGTEKAGDTLEVSELYREAAPFYFPDFEKDVRAHLRQYAKPEVIAILDGTTQSRATIREWDIADLAGGVREPTYQNITSNGVAVTTRIPQSMARLLAQREQKFQKIIREGRTGTVTFSNLKLPGEEGEETDGEVK
ncbi:Protein of unknown function, DUF547 [Erythrobacter litoralis]|uniref:DUF547 domain-containing protein n=1 Tax=Erythrobacter litoralis TaxID=39960 RepID=A0A074M8Y8_9SPHN|nr:DUF547 domain-containing protein [Erythrobacter litoralis]AOL22752.1 Protein of unknown function, DUF547 [Erythrobacter litoralis]KEO89884.1 hypothetical protein EH32_02545 [Erythrobacter litoralis]